MSEIRASEQRNCLYRARLGFVNLCHVFLRLTVRSREPSWREDCSALHALSNKKIQDTTSQNLSGLGITETVIEAASLSKL